MVEKNRERERERLEKNRILHEVRLVIFLKLCSLYGLVHGPIFLKIGTRL
jgi:hypothetical protein